MRRLINDMAIIRIHCFLMIFASVCFSNNLDENQYIQAMQNQSIVFTENKGQFDSRIQFEAQSKGISYLFTSSKVVLAMLSNSDESLNDTSNSERELLNKFAFLETKRELHFIDIEFLNANQNTQIIGHNVKPFHYNYFLGNNPDRWRSDVKNYGSITYQDIYPGIDLRYLTVNHSIKYEFIVKPGADLSRIKIRYKGQDSITLEQSGELQVETSAGLFIEKKPVIFQEMNSTKTLINGRFELIGPDTFGFIIEDNYNPNLSLVIDPELEYSTYLGGWAFDEGCDIAQRNDLIYLTGKTQSGDFPIVDPYDDEHGNAAYAYDDAFIAAFNTDASGDFSLEYCTFIGGWGWDVGYSISFNSFGEIVIAGATKSDDFPISEDAYDNTINSGIAHYYWDAFVTKLGYDGDVLIYSTYLGGNFDDFIYDMEIVEDSVDYCIATGKTQSFGFPTTFNAYDSINNNGGVLK